MLKNLIIASFRSLLKNRFFSALNIIGLSIGMAVFMLIAQYVHFEQSYENFIHDADNIYRVKLDVFRNGEQIVSSAENYPGAGPAFLREFSEVTNYARLYNLGYKNNVIITYTPEMGEPVAFKQRQFLYADSSFLSLMGYPMVAGDPATALAEPFKAVISETQAKKYFGNDNPIGKLIRMQDDDFNNELCQVTGVFKDLPPNTHLKFDVLFSYKTLFARGDYAPGRYNTSWGRKDMYTFVKLAPGTDPKMLEEKLPAIVEKYKPKDQTIAVDDVLSLQPLKSIHLHSSIADEPETNGDADIVLFLGLIGVFVIIIAWINYVNLATARAMERAREVGIRKVMGAYKNQLITQFIVESAMVNLIAIILALGISLGCLGLYNDVSGLTLSVVYFFEGWFLQMVALIWVIGAVLSGFYPAFVLSSFVPVEVLRGKMATSQRGVVLRKGLVLLQFVTSVSLIAGTLIVFNQLNYMTSQDIGVNIDQVLVVERPGISPRDRQAFNSAIDVFRNEIKGSPGLGVVSTTATVPGKQRDYVVGVKRYGTSDDNIAPLRFNSMDYDYRQVFEPTLIAGRYFSREFTADQDTSVIITESAVPMLGFSSPEDAVGKFLDIPGFQWAPKIVGVVNDYHQKSLKNALDPSIFYCTLYGGEFYSVRLVTDDLQGAIGQVEAAWTRAFPGNPFKYFFLDDYFNAQYENERKFGKLFTTFAVLAVLIGCLGLLGLATFTAQQRTKEIAIRKVLGSKVAGIFLLLLKDYLMIIGIAIVVSSPIVYFLMQNWINGFPYQTTIGVDVFALAGLVVVVISVLTVSFQTLKVATANPVKSLRSE
jgi:putative ABC transport system permease protein